MNFTERRGIMAEKGFWKLRGRIREIYGTQENFASALGVSKVSLSHKLTGQAPWKQSEIVKACDLLKIDARNVCAYFFYGVS